MATIQWDENKPAGQDSLGLGDDEIRSLKTALRTGLGTEHVWPSTGGDAGVHLLGSARAFVGTQSLVSSAGTDGRLMVTSDTSRLFHVGSAGTMFLGSALGLVMGTATGAVGRSYWAADIGSIAIDPTGVTRCTYSGSGFSGNGTPFAQLLVSGSANPMVLEITALTPTYFDAITRDSTTANFATGGSIYWFSVGTRTL